MEELNLSGMKYPTESDTRIPGLFPTETWLKLSLAKVMKDSPSIEILQFGGRLPKVKLTLSFEEDELPNIPSKTPDPV